LLNFPRKGNARFVGMFREENLGLRAVASMGAGARAHDAGATLLGQLKTARAVLARIHALSISDRSAASRIWNSDSAQE